MRDPERIDPIIEELRRYWHAHPDMRLGQIVVGATGKAAPRHKAVEGVPDPFYVEDDRMVQGIRLLP